MFPGYKPSLGQLSLGYPVILGLDLSDKIDLAAFPILDGIHRTNSDRALLSRQAQCSSVDLDSRRGRNRHSTSPEEGRLCMRRTDFCCYEGETECRAQFWHL